MSVTVVDKTITMTAQSDEVVIPIVIKSIHWIGAVSAGHLLEIAQSSTIGDNTKVIYSDVAAGPNYVSRSLVEKYYPFGIELTDLDSGTIQIIME
jgi:hypothetical protein